MTDSLAFDRLPHNPARPALSPPSAPVRTPIAETAASLAVSRPEVAEPAPLLWEELVTTGHVRAARLRHIQPALIGSAVALVIAGTAWFMLLYEPPAARPLAEVIQQRRDQEQKLAYRGFRLVNDGRTYLADNERRGKTVKDAVPAASLTHLVDANLKALADSGKLASIATIPQVKQPPEVFWQALWPLGEVNYMAGDDVVIVGAIVGRGPNENPPLARWMGIFKKAGGTWHFAALQNNGALLEVEGLPVVAFGDIPLTIKPFIPAAQLADAPRK